MSASEVKSLVHGASTDDVGAAVARLSELAEGFNKDPDLWHAVCSAAAARAGDSGVEIAAKIMSRLGTYSIRFGTSFHDCFVRQATSVFTPEQYAAFVGNISVRAADSTERSRWPTERTLCGPEAHRDVTFRDKDRRTRSTATQTARLSCVSLYEAMLSEECKMSLAVSRAGCHDTRDVMACALSLVAEDKPTRGREAGVHALLPRVERCRAEVGGMEWLDSELRMYYWLIETS